jgi:hypothetical protein
MAKTMVPKERKEQCTICEQKCRPFGFLKQYPSALPEERKGLEGK